MPTVTSVTSHFPSAVEGFTTTLASTISSGATTVPLNSVSGYTNGATVVMVVEPTSTTAKQAFTGVVDTAGVQITSVIWTEGTNQSHAAGSTVVDYVTATHMSMVTKGLLVAHNQDGTIKNNAITSAAQITDGVIGNAEMATAVKPITLFDETSTDFVASGCVWSGDSYGSTRAASMTSGVIYVDGNRVTVSAVTARTFTASKDTYIDVGTDGTVDYSEVSNNAASPALAASHIRIGIIITGASSIANAGSVNQGELDKVLPIASSVAYSVTDSLGNLICNRSSNPTLIGYKQITSGFNTSTTGNGTAITGLSCPVIIPTGGRKIKITSHCYAATTNGSAAASASIYLWESSVGGTSFGGAQLGGVSNESTNGQLTAVGHTFATAGLHTYLPSAQTNTGTATLNANSGTPYLPIFISVELE